MSKTVLFCMHQETGHLNPTFKLARTLARRGHDVSYFAIADLAPQIEAQGFKAVPWFPDLFPKGFHKSEGAVRLFARRRRMTERYHQIAERLLGNDQVSAEIANADLFIVDVNEPLAAMAARQFGVRTVLINTSLPQTRDGDVPLSREQSLPQDNSVPGEWRKFFAKRRLLARLASTAGVCPPYELTNRMASWFGYRTAELDDCTIYMPQVTDLPELVLCPQAFDFPRPALPSRHYIESIDLERKESSFAWEKLQPGKPLVYCSFGSQCYRPLDVVQFFKRLIQVFARNPQIQLVLSVGQYVSTGDVSPWPPNVMVVEKAPQIGLLQRAAAMITHGGLGSIKECLMHSVPMLVFPLDIDQPGNAARVAYHGVGLVGDVRDTSVAQLEAMVHAIVNDKSFAKQATRMTDRFKAVEQFRHGADVVEAML